MKQLTVEQFELCLQYLNLISGIEEGFEYITASFSDFSKTEGDIILSDILEALTMIAQTNMILGPLFIEDESIQQTIRNFQNVINAAFQLEGHFDEYDKMVKVVSNFLLPTFSNWKVSARNSLSGYIVQ